MSKISLSKIGFFNPSRLSDHEIELGFIARQAEFQFLLESILSHEPKEVPQHIIMIGQRGMGKTSLLLRIAVELKKEPHNSKFIPLQYPEEQYNIDRLSKFWLNSLDALADALDLEGKKKLSQELDKEIEGLTQSNPPEVYPIFQKWIQKIDRLPVLMVDNLNLIFDKISTEDQHRFRAILTSSGAPILLGASATSIKQTTDYGEPFYDAFQIKYLKKLSLDESIEVLKNLAQITGKPLHATFSKNRGRIATFHQLTGGTPRTLSMLFPLISDGFSEEIQNDLDAILDIITPLYKARFEELSDQMQVIMDAIALHWDPIDLEQIRKITQLENAKLSPQLKRLMDVGWIQKSNPRKGKGKFYEVSERFFNVWYLMRRSSRRQKRELYCLSKFLEVFYGEELLTMANRRLSRLSNSVDEIYLDLAIAEVIEDSSIQINLRERSYLQILEHSKTNPKVLDLFPIPNEHIIVEIDEIYHRAHDLFVVEDWEGALNILEEANRFNTLSPEIHLLKGLIFINQKEFQKAEENLHNALSINNNFFFAWHNLGNFYTSIQPNSKKAEEAYLKAIKINPNVFDSWFSLGQLYHDELNSPDKAKSAYQRALDIDPTNSLLWHRMGYLLSHELNEHHNAVAAFRKSLDIDKENAQVWNDLGNLLQDHLKDYSEAEAAYKKAISIDPNFAFPWNGLGNLYKNHIKIYTTSEEAYKKAIKIDAKFAAPWNGLGNLYKDNLKKYDKAEFAYKKAIEIDDKYDFPWSGLAKLYFYELEKFEEAYHAINMAISLNPEFYYHHFERGNILRSFQQDFVEAERAYKKSIQINPNFRNSWHALGHLYSQNLGKYENSIEAYQKAIQIDPNFSHLWEEMGFVNLIHLKRSEEAQLAFQKAVEIDDESFLGWYGIGYTCHTQQQDFKGAEAAYLKALQIDPSDSNVWNSLGNLYLDGLSNIEKARNAFSQALEKDSDNKAAIYNLIFIYRDKLNELEVARTMMNSISQNELLKDSYYLHSMLFDYLDQNVGVAKLKLLNALKIIADNLPYSTIDDWYRSAAMAVKLGYGNHFVEVLEETGHDIILRPYYEAIKALMAKDAEDYFTTIAAEVREPASQILEFMKRYIS